MKQNPFKVGDRVRFFEGRISEDVIIRRVEGDYVWTSRLLGVAHWKQCRRLVKKPRKTIWVNEYEDGILYSYATELEANSKVSVYIVRRAVPYREVKVKK